MEFHLLPINRGNPPIPPPKTPYIAADRRYDGGPWMTYPDRMGKPSFIYTKSSFDRLEFARQERKTPGSIREFESFLQTWLYFGLIAEFIGANSNDVPVDPSTKEMLNRIYETVVIEDGDKEFIRLDMGCLDKFIKMGKSRISPDPEVRKAHYNHVRKCLIYAAPVINLVSAEFNWAVKASIASLGELFSQTVMALLDRLGAPNPIPP